MRSSYRAEQALNRNNAGSRQLEARVSVAARATLGTPAATPGSVPPAVVRRLGRVDYEPTWRAMQRFTAERAAASADEIWFLEHPPVFTLGMNAEPAHVLAPGDIPVVQIDRGGQVTYHGPGQLVVYPLIDLRRAGLGCREFVSALERAVIELAAEFGIAADRRRGAPGVYVAGSKLAQRRDARAPGRQLSRTRGERGARSRAVPAHQPLRLRGLEMTQFAELGGGPRTR